MKARRQPIPVRTTLDEVLGVAARGDDGLTFVRDRQDETRLSWQEVEERARRCAGGLLQAGIAPGERVALILPTDPDFPVAFFGSLLAGAVPVPLYPPVRLGRLEEYHDATAAMLAAAGARMILTNRRVRSLLGETVVRARPELGCRVLSDLDLSSPAPHPQCHPEDLALVQFSSGTTRSPRPVALTHAALMAQCEAMRPLLRGHDDAGQRGVSWLPLYHDMGLIGALLGAVTYPGPLTLIPPEQFLAQPALWLQTISRQKATISPAPPFAFALCTRRIRDEEMEGCDLSSWRLAICGAEPIQPSVLERFSARFARWGFRTRALAPAYGLAEASLAVTCTPPDQDPSFESVDPGHLAVGEKIRPGPRPVTAVGTTLFGTELEIRDGSNRLLTAGHCGHIWVRGPTVMREYLDQPEATAEVLCDGWLDTGDLGFVLADRLHVIGRTKDIVVVRGANHRTEEFEACLQDLPGVRPGRVVAGCFMPADADGEELLLLVERSPHARDVTDADLVTAVNRRIRARTGIQPGKVVILKPGTLLRTSSGKLRRSASVQQYLAGTLTPPGAVHGAALTGQVLRSAFGFLRARLRP